MKDNKDNNRRLATILHSKVNMIWNWGPIYDSITMYKGMNEMNETKGNKYKYVCGQIISTI